MSGVTADADELRDVDKLIWITLVAHFVRCWAGLPAKSSKSGKSDARGRTGVMHPRIKIARIEFRGRTGEPYDATFKIRTART